MLVQMVEVQLKEIVENKTIQTTGRQASQKNIK